MAYNGLFRGGELFRDEGIKVHDIEWNESNKEVAVVLLRDKSNRKGEGVKVILKDYNGLSAYKLLKQWFDKHQLWNKPKYYVMPYLRWAKGKTVLDFQHRASISRWRKDIKKFFSRAGIPGEFYSGHSFRAGGATDLFTANVPYPQIKKMGRWKIDAALIYFKAADKVAEAVSQGFEYHSYRLRHKRVSIQGTGEQYRSRH